MHRRTTRHSRGAVFALAFATLTASTAHAQTSKNAAASVEPRVSKITIEVPSDVNEPGLSASLDGTPLGDAAWGVGMPVDPGAPQVTAPDSKAPPVVIDHDVLKIPVSDEPRPSAGSGQRGAGFVIGGVGLVSLGVGSYFGLRAMSKWNERTDQCTPGCTEGAKSAGDSAKSAALISDIGFGVGIAALGVATYLVLSAKSNPESSGQARSLQLLPAVGPLGGGLALRGSY